MNNLEHWPILQQLDLDFCIPNSVQYFMVLNEEAALLVTNDRNGYLFGKFELGESRQCVKQFDRPELIDVRNIVQAAHGSRHDLLLTGDGTIYSFNWNKNWEDDMMTDERSMLIEPELVECPHRFVSIRCGKNHSVALTEDGKVFAWGSNDKCQIGAPKSEYPFSNSPLPIAELDQHRTVSIVCGDSHSLALTDRGEVYSWGNNSNGQLGTCLDNLVTCQQYRVFVVSVDYTRIPFRMGIPSPIKAIAAGSLHSLLLTESGQVWACGSNQYGQLGDNLFLTKNRKNCYRLRIVSDSLPPITQIASQYDSNLSIALSEDGTCFVWGEMKQMSISVPFRLSASCPTIDSFFALSLARHTANLVQVRDFEFCPLFSRLSRMFDNRDTGDVQFVANDHQSIHVHRSILCNASGYFNRIFSQSDLNSSQSTIPITDHSYIVYRAYLKFLYTGRLEISNNENLIELIKLANSNQELDLQQKCSELIESTTGLGHSTTLTWPILQKLENFDEFLEKITYFLVIGNGEGVVVTTENGDAYWFGRMRFEEVPESGTVSMLAAKPKKLSQVSNICQMAHGTSHILLLTQEGLVFAFGQNDWGQLGCPPLDEADYAKSYKGTTSRYKMHICLEPRLISSSYRFRSIRCGSNHSLALTEDGQVFGWGANDRCQLAIIDGEGHSVRHRPSLQRVSALSNYRIVQIACGFDHSLALTDDGQVYAWGYNLYFQLGHRNQPDGYRKSCCRTPTRIDIPFLVKSIAGGRSHSLMLTQCGQVFIAGCDDIYSSPENYNLRKVSDLPPIIAIAAHFKTRQSIAVTFDQCCYVWGDDCRCGNKPQKLPPFYSTIDSVWSLLSNQHDTPYSFPYQAPNLSPLSTRLYQMLNNPATSPDVKFVFANSDPILAHRAILQNSSPYFERLFSKSWFHPDPATSLHSITVPDHCRSVFLSYLRFLYSDRFEVSPGDLPALYQLSSCYLEDRLHRLCLSRIRSSLSVSNCCLYYQLLDRHLLPPDLHQTLFEFISVNFDQVLSSASFQLLDPELRQKLHLHFQSDTNKPKKKRKKKRSQFPIFRDSVLIF